MKTLMSRSRGFTLIELLIVIAIIAILSGIMITNFSSSRARSRDGKRVSDISQIQLALEQYFDRCQQYPSALTNPTAGITSSTCPSGVTLANFISQIPTPPSAATYDYATFAPGAPNNLTITDYVLHTRFETRVAALDDSLRSGSSPTTPAWFTNLVTKPFNCYDPAASVFDYCIGSR
jgi:prepilin-type N-terminal cleavage/methylation domain-containing protein